MIAKGLVHLDRVEMEIFHPENGNSELFDVLAKGVSPWTETNYSLPGDSKFESGSVRSSVRSRW